MEMESRIQRALLSMSDKTGLVEFATFLAQRGIELVSTGNTARTLRASGLAVVEVSDRTGFPDIFDGRVKTLHPKIHGGILAVRDLPAHRKALGQLGIDAIDLVAVNLYPFEATVAAGADFAECIENIDIGGPALVRAAAKNHRFVTVIVDSADFAVVMAEMNAHGGATSAVLRVRLAAAAFARTATYDGEIADWMADASGEDPPQRLTLTGRLRQRLRYGENPHQRAALYSTGSAALGVARARQIQGKELSYNNLNDTDAALRLVSEFEPSAAVIVKHANPCGVAVGASAAEAYGKALACDPQSAFGGIIALNRPLDAECAARIAEMFIEVVIVPEAKPEAREILAAKRNLRLLVAAGPAGGGSEERVLRSIAGGFLVQTRDSARTSAADLEVVTRRPPTEGETADLLFAFTVCKHVSSNAIVLAREGATVGIGAGQTSRVDAAHIAAGKADRTKSSVVASDAFFPFPDGLQVAIEAGATAAIQPGGSKRDAEVIAAADEAGVAMVFTGQRHFRH